MKITLNPTTTPFSLDYTLQCGQVFRWKKQDNWWYGIVTDKALKIKQNHNALEFEGANRDFIEKYFRLDDPLPLILQKISKDKHIKNAVRNFHGLRLIRQDPWECLISYVCATNKNIPAIKNMIDNLTKQFGNQTAFDGYLFHTFPEPRSLASASIEELTRCKLGFRAKSVLKTAKQVDNKNASFVELEKMPYEIAKKELLKLAGVGDKVADCVLLFSLNKLEAFPVDVWMKKTIIENYRGYFGDASLKALEKKALTPRQYREVGSFAREYFGVYAGYAQQYLFHHERSVCRVV
jgi:N-glycosylase/DNA lyase